MTEIGVDTGTHDIAAAGQGTAIADIGAAAVCAITTATFAVSYAALIFAGPLAVGQRAGLVAVLTTCLVAGVVTGLSSSLRFASASLDGNSVVVLAAMAAVIGHAMGPDASPAALSATLLTMLMLAGLVIGAVMATLGWMRAGRIVRFVPYQVMAGFLGATGWSLAFGGATVGLGSAPDWPTMTTPDGAAKLAATIGIGIVLQIGVPRLRHPFALPAMVVGFIALHHAVGMALGVPLPIQTARGWLLDAPAHLPVALPWSVQTLQLVNWRALETAAPGLLAVVAVSVVTVMLNVNALEFATHTDADIDRELLAGGLSAAASGLLGGAPGYIAFSRSLLLLRAGAMTRLAPCLAALMAGLVPLVDPSLLGLAPRPVLGGLLVYLGLQLMGEWVVRSRRHLSLPEWLTVLLVVGVTIRFGFVVGVFAGVALGCANFAITYSRAAPTRTRYRGDVATSQVSRPPGDRALLHADAEALLVLHLQGFLFFGTANRLLQDVRAEIAALQGRLRFLVLDLQNVDGIDGSAVSCFGRIAEIVAAERIVLVLTAVPAAVAARLRTLRPVAGAESHVFATLDEGLEWCEETRLRELQTGETDGLGMQEQIAAVFGDPTLAARFIASLDTVMVAKGTELMRQDELSDELMFVASGRVSIILQFPGAAEVRARTIGAGTMIGEIGFLLGKPRTATVRADTDCHLLRLTRAMLQRIEHDDPELGFAFHRAMAQFLANRLIDKDGMIAALIRVTR